MKGSATPLRWNLNDFLSVLPPPSPEQGGAIANGFLVLVLPPSSPEQAALGVTVTGREFG